VPKRVIEKELDKTVTGFRNRLLLFFSCLLGGTKARKVRPRQGAQMLTACLSPATGLRHNPDQASATRINPDPSIHSSAGNIEEDSPLHGVTPVLAIHINFVCNRLRNKKET